MAQQINFKRYKNINFEYKGNTIRMTSPRWNQYTFCFMTDITCNEETIYGVTLRGGVNLMRQFNTPFNLYIINSEDIALDPITFNGLRAYILEDTDIQNILGAP